MVIILAYLYHISHIRSILILIYIDVTRQEVNQMRKHIFFLVMLVSVSFSLNASDNLLQRLFFQNTPQFCPKIKIQPSTALKDMLHREASTLNTAVINKVMSVLTCVNKYNIDHNNILTIVDYSLPASEKRLWVFDLEDKKLLFNTYVSHGIKSGALLSTLFSNKYDSKTSSIGVYRTEKTYYGRDGLSLRLDGLDSGFNSNASNRSIVMHGGWYVEEKFIKKYGRSGRSWGCPAVPLDMAKPIINAIKENSLLIAYYPSDDWLSKSRFLRCEHLSPIQTTKELEISTNPITSDDSAKRDDILFADIHKKGNSEENTAVLVMTADNYKRIFSTAPPLGRMLRRQINNVEYIALSTTEFQNVITHNLNLLSDVYFVRPAIKMIRGYYETQMQIVNLGKIKNVTPNTNNEPVHSYTVSFETSNSINLRATDRFIRWLGL